MILEVPLCPTCREPAVGIAETMLCTAMIQQEDDGSFEYAGESKVHWDTQEATLGADKRARVECDAGHEWETGISE